MNGVCLTGNRPIKIPFLEESADCCELKSHMREVVISLIAEGYTHFISGMAQGSDIWFAECIIELKKLYDNIMLEATIPYAGQCDRLSYQSKNRYRKILEHSDKISVLSEEYTPYCLDKRNRYMVDNSDVVLAISFAESGGTVNTVKYARKKNKRIIFLNN